MTEHHVLTVGVDTTERLGRSCALPVLIETRLLQGTAAAALIEESASADLLVVGARGRGALKAALLGSTSNHAIHHAHCPVVIIRADTAMLASS
jgi:nucleotide-binding universal stress UspA family protein